MNQDVKFLLEQAGGLRPKHKLVLFAVAVLADNSGACKFTMEELATITSLKEWRINEVLKDLQLLGVWTLVADTETAHLQVKFRFVSRGATS